MIYNDDLKWHKTDNIRVDMKNTKQWGEVLSMLDYPEAYNEIFQKLNNNM